MLKGLPSIDRIPWAKTALLGGAFAVLAVPPVLGGGRRFSTGFEPETSLPVSGGKLDYFQGKDNHTGLDWAVLPTVPGVADGARYPIAYWGGTAHVHSTAEILPDSDASHGQVLMFQVNSDDGLSPNARTSMDVDLNPDTFSEIGVRYQMKIDPAFLSLPTDPAEIPNVEGSTEPARLWWVMSEAWLRDTDGTRVSIPVDIKRLSASEYRFEKVKLRLMDQLPPEEIVTLWEESPKPGAPTLPIGEWVTVDLYMKKGFAGMGRFYLAVNQQTVFDVTHRDMAYGKFEWYQWNPLKLYLDLNTLAWMTAHGTPTRVYYDNFEVWAGVPDRFTDPPKGLRAK